MKRTMKIALITAVMTLGVITGSTTSQALPAETSTFDKTIQASEVVSDEDSVLYSYKLLTGNYYQLQMSGRTWLVNTDCACMPSRGDTC